MSIIIITFLILLIVGVPIAFVLGLSSIFYILVSENFSFLINVPQRMIAAANNFSLMAIPFFVLAGELMNNGGITGRLTNFARSLVAHFRGGLAYVNILVSMFLSSIVGSANAVAAIQSSSMVPEMKKDGYSNEYSSAVTAASSIMGPIIPPSMVFIVYGVAAGTSIGALFLAGIVPGILLGIAFMVISYFYAKKKNYPTKVRSSINDMLKSFIIASPALTIPVLIIVGIVTGSFTPTEAGAMGSLIAFILGMFIYRDLKWNHLPGIFMRTGLITATIMIIVATANIFGWTLTMERIPQMIAETLLALSENPLVILLIINLLLLLVGMFLEPFAAIIILVPVLLPIIEQLGIDPVHFGVIVTLNLVIGLITPPIGIVLFVVSGATKVSVSQLSSAVVPFIIASVIVLLFVTYIPEIVLYLPQKFLN
ncbi:tripartite ATP-independent transporter DctM subunit [Caldalkalibacillus uzonensis]|uniref:Tripartite ATP-independent transporter DctM subunit n=1 Tax=Caldalkalibacillus uzonensis TaxID=353224 RepID=A0ABU0CYE8_9BACI|nr:TRAP transporter large permease [Caldalkalibacillus uzonensis]MDQ0341181.1 tripartite ATP-independent transporter DctM subunit [Caldalkalibacillus uzonensis]